LDSTITKLVVNCWVMLSRIEGELRVMKWERRERKLPWPILSYYPSICVGGQRTKKIPLGYPASGSKLEPRTSISRSTNV